MSTWLRSLYFVIALMAIQAFVQNTDVYAETASTLPAPGRVDSATNLLPHGAGCSQTYDNNTAATHGLPGVGCSNPGGNLSQGDTTSQGFDVRSGTGYEFGSNGTQDMEANGNLTIGSSGSLENITVTKENGGTTTTTADMLDGGVTLTSTTETQNCEWTGSSYQCGQARSGRDTFTVRVQIKDASGNVLATVEQQRNTDAGYYGNTAVHEDTVTYTGEGSRNWDWQWTGTDGNNPNDTSSRQGPNLVGAALHMTLADINYSPSPPISEETQEEINEAQETVEEVEQIIENIPIEEVVNGVEEVAITEPTVEIEEPAIEEPTVEITEQAFQESFEENFTAVLEEEGLTETFEEALVEEGITEEQFFESVTEMVTEEFSTPTEETAVEEPTVEEETVVEETPTESETVNTNEESVETESETTTETATETETTESEPSTETSTESNTQETETETESTEGETESTESEETETTEQEESSSDAEESVDSEEGETSDESTGNTDASVEGDVDGEVSAIAKKVEKIIKKLESKLKTVDQKLKVISLVTQQAMIEDQPDMTEYTSQQFYDTRKIPDNPDWYAEDTILDAYGRSIYQDVTLAAYIGDDPIAQHQQELNIVNDKISRLEAELEVLKNERN